MPQLAAREGPTYMRLLRGDVPRVLDEYDYTFELGKAKVVRPGQRRRVRLHRPDDHARPARRRGAGQEAASTSRRARPDDQAVRRGDRPRRRSTPTGWSSRWRTTPSIGGLFESVAVRRWSSGASAARSSAIGLPDEFLDAGALPTLHDRYGLSTQTPS